jgi:hypothetical protein
LNTGRSATFLCKFLSAGIAFQHRAIKLVVIDIFEN